MRRAYACQDTRARQEIRMTRVVMASIASPQKWIDSCLFKGLSICPEYKGLVRPKEKRWRERTCFFSQKMVLGAQAAAAAEKRSEMMLTLLSQSPPHTYRIVAPPPPHMRRRPEDNYSSGHMPSNNSISRGAYGGGMPQAGPGRPVRGEGEPVWVCGGWLYRYYHVWLYGIGY